MPTLSVPPGVADFERRRSGRIRHNSRTRTRRPAFLPHSRYGDLRTDLQQPGARPADPAAFRVPAAPVLTLPSLANIPPFLIYRRGGYGLIGMARGLLDEGVLLSSDWTGDLSESVQAGLARWIRDEGHTARIKKINLQFCYTDDIKEWYLDCDDWISERKGVTGQPVGGFALEAQDYQEVFVGPGVMAWEEMRAGLGFSILGLIGSALWETVRGVTPRWAAEQVDGQWEESFEPEQDTEEGRAALKQMNYIDDTTLTPARLRQQLPEAACSAKWNQTLVEEALADDSLPVWKSDVLEHALELAALLDAAQKDQQFFDDQQHLDVNPVLPVAVRWSENDRMDEVSDEYHDMIANSEGESRLVWLQGYQIITDDSLVKAIRSMRRCMEIVHLVDGLLFSLTGGKTLFQVFSEEEAEQPQVRQRVRVRDI